MQKSKTQTGLLSLIERLILIMNSFKPFGGWAILENQFECSGTSGAWQTFEPFAARKYCYLQYWSRLALEMAARARPSAA